MTRVLNAWPKIFSWFRRRAAVLSLQAILLVLAINVGSKAVGFVREVYISGLYGVSDVTDAFFAIQQLPLFVSTYLFGAFTLVFVPQYAAAKRGGFAKEFLAGLLKVLVPLGFLLTALMVLGADRLVPVIAGVVRLSGGLASDFAVILALSMVPTIFWGVGYGVLHADRQHVKGMLLAAVTPFAMLVALVVLLLLPGLDPAYALPWSFVTGVAVGGAWGFHLLRRAAKSGPVPGAEKSAAGRLSWSKFSGQLSVASLENIGFSLNQLLNVHFAGVAGPGAVAVNAYALRISMLALNGIVTPLNQMIQGWLSGDEDRKSGAGFTHRFTHILGGMLLLVLFIAATVVVFREPVVRLVYERGAFSAADTMRVAQSLVPYSAYFAVMALNQLFARYLFVISKGQLYTACLLAGYLVSNVLKPFMAENFGLPGVIWACVIGEGLALLYLGIWFTRRVRRAV